jgi:glycosyltransferase involved in cell wall biosynthesis
VLQQTYSAREIIVIDDGSTDETAVIARSYAQKVTFVQQSRRGLAAARNTGLRCCSGEFVLMLDADDRLHPNAVEAGVASLVQNPRCVMSFGEFRLINRDGSVRLHQCRPPRTDTMYATLLHGNYIGMHGCVVYRRKVLLDVNGFNTQMPAAEDFELYLRLASRFDIASHSTLMADYRQHQANMSRNSSLMLQTTLMALEAQRENVQGNGVLERALAAGIANAERHYTERLMLQILRSSGKIPASAGALLKQLSISRPLLVLRSAGGLLATVIRKLIRPGLHFGLSSRRR